MEFTFQENVLIQGIFTQAPPNSKLDPDFLSSHPRKNEIFYSPRQHSSENLFPRTAERSEGKYNFFYQNSVRKYEDDLEH